MEKDIVQMVENFRKHKKWWTIVDLAEFLQISRRSAWDMIQKAEIKAVKIKREWRIHRDWVVEYLKNNTVK